MTRKSIWMFFTFILLVSIGDVLYGEPATVTNNGNLTVRVQYFPAGGTEYVDLGYLKSGETMTVPGGVEKVKIVRDYGEWAGPLRPGEKLEVEVTEGHQAVGTMTWFGEKVFFDGPTEAPPVSVNTVPPPVVKNGTKPQSETQSQPKAETQSEPTPSYWPWFSYLNGWQLTVLLFLLVFPFLLALGRSFYRPGWTMDGYYSGFNPQYVLIGLVLGFAFGFWGFWGNLAYGDDSGFLPFLAQDIYTLPFFLFVFLGNLFGGQALSVLEIFPEPMTVILFWMMVCALLGATIGVVRAPLLHGLGAVLALLPFLVFTQGGCLGPNAYAWQEGYRSSVLL